MDAQMLRNHAASTSYCSCSCPLRTPTMPRPNTTSRLAILALRPLLRHTARPGSSCEVRCGSTGAATLQPSSSSAGQEDGQHQWQGQAGGALLLCAAAVGLCAAMAAASGPGSPFMSMTVTAGLGVSREGEDSPRWHVSELSVRRAIGCTLSSTTLVLHVMGRHCL